MDFYGHNRGQVTREDNKTDAYYSDLAAHKSWFMFDDEIVCLGSGITNSENYEAITTIESRRLDGRTELKTESTVEQYDAQSVSACGDDGNSYWEQVGDLIVKTRFDHSLNASGKCKQRPHEPYNYYYERISPELLCSVYKQLGKFLEEIL